MIKTRHVLLISMIMLVTSMISHSQNTGKTIFDNTFLHEIKFESVITPVASLWDSLSYTYHMVNMIIDGMVVDSVGLRIKGLTSVTSLQKPLKVDINKYVSEQNVEGLIKINLNNNFLDSFMQREPLAYELYRNAGLPAPRTSYAEVYVDSIFRGIYSITEQIDKTFLGDRFPSKDGSLYKGIYGGFVPPPIHIDVKEGTIDAYQNYKDNANAANISEYINLRNYLKLLAVDMIIEDFDAYAYERHNFYIYYETKSELLNFISYDHNFAFDLDQAYDLFYPVGTYPLQNLIVDPTIKVLYEQTVCELLNYLLEDSLIIDITMQNFDIIELNENGVSPKNPVELIQYILDRKQALKDTLNALGVTCNSLVYPYAIDDLVINEFVASNDAIVEPDGNGTPDWIELYNNTDFEIVLNENYYLSDDKTFPKKWHFTEDVAIAPGDYLIVWADKDVHQSGIHAGFKLDKNEGELLMTYENSTLLQNINYEAQSVNKGYARIPNGTGDFVIQEHTYNINNEDDFTSIQNDEIFDAKVFPNPTKHFISIETNEFIKKIKLIDLYGRTMKEVSKPLFPIDISGITPGLYFLNIDLARSNYTMKIIIE